MLNLHKIIPMKAALYKFIFFKLLGWKLLGTISPEVKKCVMMVMPHTCNFDFFIGLFCRGIIGLEMNFVGKKELFTFPFGYYFRSIGGAPLDRSGGKNNVDATVEVFNSREVFRMAIAPEGTRKKVTQLKTGFYYIAYKAHVPIIPIAFDYAKKEVRIGQPISLSGNYEEDMKIILPHFKGAQGKFPERQFQV
jgi:1-acyl-sn-glycerol-3-phosphate acyltransferase